MVFNGNGPEDITASDSCRPWYPVFPFLTEPTLPQIKGSSLKTMLPASQAAAPQDLFGRLPDEIIENIIRLVGLNEADPSDPYELGWNEEIEVFEEAYKAQRALEPLRLVSRRFLRLSAPVYFRQLLVGNIAGMDVSSGTIIIRLTELLSARPASHLPPYGHHVRQLILLNRTEPPDFVPRLLDAIHSLIPKLTELSSLDLSQLHFLLSAGISFPFLEALTEIDAGSLPDRWAITPYAPSLTPLTASAPFNGFISQEILFGFLNYHPRIKRLSCRGLHLDSPSTVRLGSLLRSNQLAAPFLPRFQPSAQFSGLTELHLGSKSLVDLHLLQILPSVSPQIQRLHICSGCYLDDRCVEKDDDWTLIRLLGSLPELTHFTFIGQHNPPVRRGSTQWASLSQILKASPQLQSINLRSESISTTSFFESLGHTSLHRLNVWYKPPLDRSTAESWSIVSFASVSTLKKLAGISKSLFHAGLEWPSLENSRRDLWLKLEFLSKLEDEAERVRRNLDS